MKSYILCVLILVGAFQSDAKASDPRMLLNSDNNLRLTRQNLSNEYQNLVRDIGLARQHLATAPQNSNIRRITGEQTVYASQMQQRIQDIDAELRRRITRSQCGEISFNNMSNMGQGENRQGNTFHCWAYSSGRLLEEQLCLSYPDRRYCGQSISRMDILAKAYPGEYRISNVEGRGQAADALQAMLQYGSVCPSILSANPWGVGDDNFIELLMQGYQAAHNSCVDTRSREVISQRVLDGIYNVLHHNAESWGTLAEDEVFTRQTYIRLVNSSQSPNAFIEKVLLHYCNGNRRINLRASNVSPIKVEFPESIFTPTRYTALSVEPQRQAVLLAKRLNRSLEMSVCTSVLVPLLRNSSEENWHSTWNALSQNPAQRNNCSAHSTVIDAVRWNEGEARCEVHLNDSLFLSGWKPAEVVFAFAIDSIILR